MSVTEMHPEQQATNLRVVDPLTDPGVWAIVDDACNTCVHGETWRKNAAVKWNALGTQPILNSTEGTSFRGIGRSETSGKWQIPFALLLEKIGVVIPGTVFSHEVPGADHPMLLSQTCQAKMGLNKSMRQGIMTLEDYDDNELEVVRQKGTGLFMIRIDHIKLDDYRDKHNLRIHLTNTACGQAYDEDNNDAPYGFMGVRLNSKVFDKDLLDAQVIVASCGGINFEMTGFSAGISQAFREFIGLEEEKRRAEVT